MFHQTKVRLFRMQNWGGINHTSPYPIGVTPRMGLGKIENVTIGASHTLFIYDLRNNFLQVCPTIRFWLESGEWSTRSNGYLCTFVYEQSFYIYNVILATYPHKLYILHTYTSADCCEIVLQHSQCLYNTQGWCGVWQKTAIGSSRIAENFTPNIFKQ